MSETVFLLKIIKLLQDQLNVSRQMLQAIQDNTDAIEEVSDICETILTVSEESLETLKRIEILVTPPPRPTGMKVTYARRVMPPTILRTRYEKIIPMIGVN